MDFGSKSVKIAEGTFSKGNLNIMNTFSIDLPKGVYDDGYILDENILKETIDSGLRLNNIQRGDTIAVVDSTNILTREISLPNVTAEDIEGILMYKIDDYIPIDIEDYIVQYIRQGTLIEDGNEKIKLFIIAMPKDLIVSHLNLLKDLDLRPRILDFKSNSVRKILQFSGKNNSELDIAGKTIANIDFAFSNTKLTILKDGNIMISRVINMGIKDILENLKSDSNLDLSENELMEKLLELENIDDETCEISVALRIFLMNFFENIEMVFRYYNSLDPRNNVDLILLQNIFAENHVLRSKFYEYLDIETKSISSLQGIIDKDLNIYSNAVGSLIRGEEI